MKRKDIKIKKREIMQKRKKKIYLRIHSLARMSPELLSFSEQELSDRGNLNDQKTVDQKISYNTCLSLCISKFCLFRNTLNKI